MESQREYNALRTKGDECAYAIPAFETPKTVWNRPQYGLTKREHFASMALQGLVSAEIDDLHINYAYDAVQMADALIEALNDTYHKTYYRDRYREENSTENAILLFEDLRNISQHHSKLTEQQLEKINNIAKTL
jgi:hypothetical protein